MSDNSITQTGLFQETELPHSPESDTSGLHAAADVQVQRPTLAERCTGLLFCSRCGAPTSRAADAEFCPLCGMRRCVSCGDL